ncbi:unnamed protein product (macronuclear) [Paramecium tetraurelia]|uniref:Transmembrane protein n=1 Tax=Paramecium tetraurelia TaxID=5888 RepID=A0BFC5_PARTE|nr:uncharacterized protein GSPATT00028277001 [Paramecium tetraurelia]CAK57242.1 unnamed protein product [Paramecium tetraurelia]|eukprot:XP_001424640.1 hypothetical protein (macronuclear) [Paramecium tetraurelia strain d4-2]
MQCNWNEFKIAFVILAIYLRHFYEYQGCVSIILNPYIRTNITMVGENSGWLAAKQKVYIESKSWDMYIDLNKIVYNKQSNYIAQGFEQMIKMNTISEQPTQSSSNSLLDYICLLQEIQCRIQQNKSKQRKIVYKFQLILQSEKSLKRWVHLKVFQTMQLELESMNVMQQLVNSTPNINIRNVRALLLFSQQQAAFETHNLINYIQKACKIVQEKGLQDNYGSILIQISIITFQQLFKHIACLFVNRQMYSLILHAEHLVIRKFCFTFETSDNICFIFTIRIFVCVHRMGV